MILYLKARMKTVYKFRTLVYQFKKKTVIIIIDILAITSFYSKAYLLTITQSWLVISLEYIFYCVPDLTLDTMKSLAVKLHTKVRWNRSPFFFVDRFTTVELVTCFASDLMLVLHVLNF